MKAKLSSLAASAKESLREQFLKALAASSKLRGAECLDREQTISYCNQIGYTYEAGEPTTFELGEQLHKIELMRCGVVRLNGSKCLYTDFGNRAAAIDFSRGAHQQEHVIAVWSHRWLGFHHYLTELFPKICRLRETLGKDFGGAKICYPMIHRRYEKELIELLEIKPENVIDCWQSGGIFAKKLTIIPMAGWFGGNPNADLLYKQFVTNDPVIGPERLYLTRSGRRQCLNDKALIDRCKAMNFEIIDETSRSIQDQIKLYQNAKILVGPHGSAFSNMVWSKPGLHVIEMVPTTFDVEYHKKLSYSLGHNYTKISCDNGRHATTGVTIDFDVDLDHAIRIVESATAALDCQKSV